MPMSYTLTKCPTCSQTFRLLYFDAYIIPQMTESRSIKLFFHTSSRSPDETLMREWCVSAASKLVAVSRLTEKCTLRLQWTVSIRPQKNLN